MVVEQPQSTRVEEPTLLCNHLKIHLKIHGRLMRVIRELRLPERLTVGLATCSCVDSRPNMSGCRMPIGGTHVHRHRQPDSSKHCHGLVSATSLVRREHVGPPA